ncbi:MAG: hypothetical protein ACFBZ8_10360 [Opitutales bacterium]
MTERRYWLTPPKLKSQLDAEFGFDFDPCPCPRPAGYNSLVVPWGAVNYVNPPFLEKDAPFGALQVAWSLRSKRWSVTFREKRSGRMRRAFSLRAYSIPDMLDWLREKEIEG